MSSYTVVKRNAGLVTNFELLHLLRQRGVRTAEESAAAEEAAWAAQSAKLDALSLRDDVEVEDEEEAPVTARAAEGGTPAASQPPGGRSRDGGADAPSSTLPPPLYPRVNPPFAIERAVLERLLKSPAATQDAEKLKHFLELVAEVELTKSEALQLVNSKPRTLVELHTLVEHIDSRLNAEEQEDLLQLCTTVL